MDNNRLPMLAVGVVIGLVALSGLAVTYPALSTMRSLERQTADLQAETERIEACSNSTQELAARLAATQDRFALEHKSVPPTPDIASLIRKLGTFGEGGEQTYRQTLTTGQVQQEASVNSLPVILETRGSFLEAFDLVQRIEDLDRLARLRRVTVTRDPGDDQVIRATIQLDAFFGHAEEAVAGAAP